MRGVPDTNVIVSAFLSSSSHPAQALFLLNRSGQMLASNETLDELRAVLSRPKFASRLSAQTRERLLAQFTAQIELIPITEHVRACRVPRDDKFLSLALGGRADLILTGDHDLLDLHPFHGIAILAPS